MASISRVSLMADLGVLRSFLTSVVEGRGGRCLGSGECLALDKFSVDPDDPLILSISENDAGVMDVYFNRFDVNLDLISDLSGQFGRAVVNLYQSTSDAFGWILFQDGQLLRKIVVADGGVIEDEGARFPFEPAEGHEVQVPSFLTDRSSIQDFEDLDWFDERVMEAYNHRVGIPVAVLESPGDEWVNYQI